jgi:hypothetical protein
MFSVKYFIAVFTFCLVNSVFAGEGAGRLKGYSIPLIDLAGETYRQIIVDKEPGQYLGHPTTVLLEDNKTIIAVYPKGHGRGAIVMKKSTDGGFDLVGEIARAGELGNVSGSAHALSGNRLSGQETAHHVLGIVSYSDGGLGG